MRAQLLSFPFQPDGLGERKYFCLPSSSFAGICGDVTHALFAAASNAMPHFFVSNFFFVVRGWFTTHFCIRTRTHVDTRLSVHFFPPLRLCFIISPPRSVTHFLFTLVGSAAGKIENKVAVTAGDAMEDCRSWRRRCRLHRASMRPRTALDIAWRGKVTSGHLISQKLPKTTKKKYERERERVQARAPAQVEVWEWVFMQELFVRPLLTSPLVRVGTTGASQRTPTPHTPARAHEPATYAPMLKLRHCLRHVHRRRSRTHARIRTQRARGKRERDESENKHR